MGIQLFSKNRHYANIVIKDHAIRFVELKQTSPIVVQRVEERQLPKGIITNGKIVDYETLSTIMEQCVDEWRIKHRKVRFVVPDGVVIIKKISVPADIPDNEIKGYLHLELGTTIHLPFEDPTFDMILLHDKEGEQAEKDVLIFAAPEDIVNSYKDLFEDAKLKPCAADISPLSLYRLYFHTNDAVHDENVLLVEFDQSAMNISIFSTHIPVFMRHSQIETQAIEGQNPVFYIQDSFKEMERVINFFQYSLHHGQKSVNRIILTGEHPEINIIKDELITRFNIPVTSIDGANISIITANNQELPGQYHVPLGLALKEV
ncbi:type IV pilus biogenesis protein PilM [Bacillus sp. HMF5848]|uniref:type IV pilus biogenesis protein PilM n=1 Tax=Bacillus sp. HMF5848 TaxID=2495421 RepID=UPI001639E27B|nr:pilus assembly protein PilM [Bacillus sp. HMF5848]